MIVLPHLTSLWMILTVMIAGGIGLALVDRMFAIRRFPIGLAIFSVLFLEEIGSLLYGHFNGEVKALYLILPVTLFFVALAVIYGITKAMFWALPHRSKSP